MRDAEWTVPDKGRTLHRLILATKRRMEKRPEVGCFFNLLIELSTNEKRLCMVSTRPEENFKRMVTAVAIMITELLNQAA